MKVMDGIKQAVLAQDWNMICKIYTAVTKEPLEPPKPKSEIEVLAELELPESLSNALSGIDNDAYELQKALNTKKKPGRPKKKIELSTAPAEQDGDGPAIRVDEEDIDRPIVRRQKRVQQKFGDKGQQARTESINTGKRRIKFFGEGSNSDSHKNNPELQKLYGGMKHNRTTREVAEDIDVVCSVCGKEESVSPIIGTNYNEDPDENTYKCNRCCSRG